jgi:DDE superfamily endonuclease
VLVTGSKRSCVLGLRVNARERVAWLCWLSLTRVCTYEAFGTAQPPGDHAFVKTTGPQAAAAARIGAGLGRRKRAELLELLRPCFARVAPWLQAGKYTAALMSQITRRNGWTTAEHAGDRTPDKTQRLLNRAVWDTFAAMRVVRRFAVAGLDEAARRRGLAVAAIDETAQVKQGECTAGVKRHYLGCAGKVANGITTVHLAYAREGAGHALIAARQWIPREHIEDSAKRQVMGLPPDLVFRTKGQLAIDLLTEVLADGIRLDFACGDEVYGSCIQFREFCEARGSLPGVWPVHGPARAILVIVWQLLAPRYHDLAADW